MGIGIVIVAENKTIEENNLALNKLRNTNSISSIILNKFK